MKGMTQNTIIIFFLKRNFDFKMLRFHFISFRLYFFWLRGSSVKTQIYRCAELQNYKKLKSAAYKNCVSLL